MTLLLHSMSNFAEITERALAHLRPRRIVEIGAEFGGSTLVLLRYAAAQDAHVDVVDPSPFTDLAVALQEYDGHYTHHALKSVDALDGLAPADIYLIDGDHNYWTVTQELRKIHARNPKAWIFLHDVGFPWGRRDSYYNPSDIPPEFLHPHSYTAGVTFASELAPSGGFRGEGAFASALHEGGPRNGVLTAVEDFLAAKPSLDFQMILPIFGLGIVAPIQDRQFVANLLEPYRTGLMDRMEANRMELYLKVIELQDALSRAHRRLRGVGIRRRIASLFRGRTT